MILKNFLGINKVSNQSQVIKMWNEEFHINKIIKDIKFIHIGKCGGTSIMNYLLRNRVFLEEYHLKKPPLNEKIQYFMWVRDPVSRFISAFNHLKEIVEFPIEMIDNPLKLTLKDCPAPGKIINKCKKGFAFSKTLDEAIMKFDNADDLISSLHSTNKSLRFSAESIMNSNYEHIKKGIAWYLHKGKFIEKNHHKFLMVGRIETFKEDLNILLKGLNLEPYESEPHLRKSKIRTENKISEISKKYLIKNYLAEDYYCLELLKEKSLIKDYSQKII